MTIPFIFVLTWLIPEVEGFSKNEIMSLVESARQSSIPRIRKYAGYAFVTSLFLPPIIFTFIFVALDLFPSGMYFAFFGMIGLLSVLSNQLLTSIFNTLILKPAIYDQLNKKLQLSKPST